MLQEVDEDGKRVLIIGLYGKMKVLCLAKR